MQIFVHTYYTFFESNLSIVDYINNLSKLDQRFAFITDKNNIYGMWEFIKLSRQKNIFPIVGCHIAPKILQNKNIYSNGGFLLFLRSIDGLHSFNSIITSSTNGKNFNEVYEKISNLSAKKELEDIIFISLTSKVYNLLKYLGIPETNLYFGLIEDIFTTKPFLTSTQLNFFENFDYKNPIFVSKVLSVGEIENELFDLLFTLRLNKLVRRKDAIFKKRKPILDKTENIYKNFYLSDNTNFLKDRKNPYSILSNEAKSKIALSIENLKNFHLRFSEIKSKAATFPSFYENPYLRLRQICLSKLKEKNLDKNQAYICRLNYELDIINKKDFCQYFLFVYEIIEYAKENEISYIGRGSAASSLVAYLMDITEVDPIRLNLYFERFLNPERESYPDIDIDFSWKNRDKILLYILKKYPSNCCMVSTTLKMNLKSAFRNCAKFYGMDTSTITKYSKLIPSFLYTKDYEKVKRLLNDIGIDENIANLAIKVLNLPYAKGVHPGGIVLSYPDLFCSTPFLYAKKGVPISHFDLNYIEDAGLIKIDILSQRALGVFQDSIENIREIYDSDFNLNFELANNDDKTWENIRKGNCRGCFYIESAAMVNLLRDLDVKNFLELVAASSVIRPGVSDSGMKEEYILRKRGLKKFEYDIPILKDILSETFGIMIYQEDVLKVASSIGKLSLSQADSLRKAMSGKSRSKDEIKKLKEKFIEGGLCQNYSIINLEKIWFQIESFAGYAFCKAHSASYAVLSVKMAYLRTHFAPVFYAAVLNNFGGFYPPIAYNILALIEKIPITLSKLKSAKKLTYFDGEKIVIGLINFFFLNDKEKEILLSLSIHFQQEKEFVFSKFIFLSNFEKQKIIKLIQIGYFSEFYEPTGFLLILCEYLFLEKDRSLNNLIAKEKDFFLLKNHFTENILYLYYYRYKYLGIFVDATPFDILKKMEEYQILSDDEIATIKKYKLKEDIYNLSLNNKYIKLIGWLITYRSAATKDGKLMGFATFFDGKDFIETVIFPDSYAKYYNLLKYYNLFLLNIEIKKDIFTSFAITEIKPFIPDFFQRLKEGTYGTNNKETKTDT